MNLFSQILALIKRDPEIAQPLMQGEVIAAHADGTVTVQLQGGGQQRIRGTAAVSSRVFFKDGRIEGPAPDLVLINIEE